jgi:hypothetical protein
VSQLVVQVSAQCKTLYIRPPGLGTCHFRASKAACKRSTLGKARDEPLGVDGDPWRNRSRTSSRVAKRCMTARLGWGWVTLKSLRAPASAGCWRKRGNELLRFNGNLRREGLRTCSHVVKLLIAVQLNSEYVSPKFLRAREGAGCWRKRGMSC